MGKIKESLKRRAREAARDDYLAALQLNRETPYEYLEHILNRISTRNGYDSYKLFFFPDTVLVPEEVIRRFRDRGHTVTHTGDGFFEVANQVPFS
jgi:hypothetical protein